MTHRSASTRHIATAALALTALAVSAQTTAPAATQPGNTGAAATLNASPTAKDRAAAEAAFARANAKGDGKMTRDEAAQLPAIAAKFDDLDKNKDGMLSLDEFSPGYLSAK